VDRAKAARWQINVADVQDAIQTAVGGNALTQVLRARNRITSRCAICLSIAIRAKPSRTSACCRPRENGFRWPALHDVREADEGSEIYRENNERYVAIKYSVRGRALGDAVREAIDKVNAQVKLPRGYHIGWEGEYQSEVRAEARMPIIVPLTVLLIFIILYSPCTGRSSGRFADSGHSGHGQHRADCWCC
jgi:heavy metal efflux system protein